MSRYVGYENGELVQYALVYVNEAEWELVRGRVGYNRDDYCELLRQFGEDSSFQDDVVPVAESYIDECWQRTGGRCFIEIESYSPTFSPNIIDTIIIEEDGRWYHENIASQGYGTDHLYD